MKKALLPFFLFIFLMPALGLVLESCSSMEGRNGFEDPRIVMYEGWEEWKVDDFLRLSELQRHWGKNAFFEGVGRDTEVLTSRIEVFDGNNVLRAEYWEGDCCYKSDNKTINGSAVSISIYNHGIWDFDTIALSYNLWMDPKMENRASFKLPGWSNRDEDNSDDHGVGRLTMHNGSYHGKENVLNNYCYDVEENKSPDVSINWEFPRGEWVNLTVIWVAGTPESDGFQKVYINGLHNAGISDDIKYVRWKSPEHDYNWNTFEFELNMGGNDPKIWAPSLSTFIRIDDLVIWEPGKAILDSDISRYLPELCNFKRR